MSESKIRINISTGEVEIVGSESFVNANIHIIQQIVSGKTNADQLVAKNKEEDLKLAETKTHSAEDDIITSATTDESDKSSINNDITTKVRLSTKLPVEEYFAQFPKSIKNGDIVLIAGYYIQKNSSENYFTTFLTSKLLKEINSDLTNPSQYVKNNNKNKKTRMIDKSKYRLTKFGLEYLRSLIKNVD